jgi:hypothetical protein
VDSEDFLSDRAFGGLLTLEARNDTPAVLRDHLMVYAPVSAPFVARDGKTMMVRVDDSLSRDPPVNSRYFGENNIKGAL